VDGALHGMVDLHIVGARRPDGGQRQEARMLARAVVVDLAGLFRPRGSAPRPWACPRACGAAAEVGLAQAQSESQASTRSRVDARALVGGAGERQCSGPSPPPGRARIRGAAAPGSSWRRSADRRSRPGRPRP
jgi:hypothetical protein